MIKAILVDGDGMAIIKTKYFSEIFAKEYNVPEEKIRPFFKDKYRACQKGRADLKVELVPFLKEWGWQGTDQDFLNYWFVNNTKADEKFIGFLQTLRATGIKCYLVSDQEKYRAEYISNELHFKGYFDDCFYACDLKFDKSQKEFFEVVIKKLNLYPKEILFYDDEDIEMAKEVGINANIYKDFENFKRDVEIFLKIS